eukprot:13791233-Heterocapsa_arctica.AAC.1
MVAWGSSPDFPSRVPRGISHGDLPSGMGNGQRTKECALPLEPSPPLGIDHHHPVLGVVDA